MSAAGIGLRLGDVTTYSALVYIESRQQSDILEIRRFVPFPPLRTRTGAPHHGGEDEEAEEDEEVWVREKEAQPFVHVP